MWELIKKKEDGSSWPVIGCKASTEGVQKQAGVFHHGSIIKKKEKKGKKDTIPEMSEVLKQYHYDYEWSNYRTVLQGEGDQQRSRLANGVERNLTPRSAI